MIINYDWLHVFLITFETYILREIDLELADYIDLSKRRRHQCFKLVMVDGLLDDVDKVHNLHQVETDSKNCSKY